MPRSRNPDLDENSAGTRVTSENTTGNGVAPQITSTIGVPEPPPEVIEATGGAGAVTVLNPNAPINRLSEGGITFAYPDLVYSQFIDIDQQIEVTDDTSPNSLVLQIPYHPISQYTNEYIQSYARMHSRYNGDIIFRAQIIGNATFSGTLMWFWWPTKYPKQVVSMADAMKYSYKSQSIQLNSVEELVHKDARQYLYFRSMDEFDIETRPHLVLMVHTSIQSPLKSGIKIRIRIGSRLASASPADRMKMASPFIFANPLPLPSSGTPGGDDVNGKFFPNLLPHYRTRVFRMLTDGNTTAPYSLVDSERHGYNFSLHSSIPGVTGRDGHAISTDSNFLYRKTAVLSSPSGDTNSIVYVLHQLPPSVVTNISAAPAFATMTTENSDKTVEDVPFIKNHIKVYATRTIAPNLLVDTGIYLQRQTTCYTNYGKVVVVLLQIKRGEIPDFENMGFPNISGGTPMMYPHTDVLGPTNFTNNLSKLPTTWVSVKLSDEEPSVVNSLTDIAPSQFTDVATLELFKDLTKSLVEDQVLQFDLVDGEARTRVATLRYIPGRQEFVLNPSEASGRYKLYAGDLNNLVFANFGVQPAAAAFPLTDTSAWLARVPASQLTVSQLFRTNKLNLFTANPTE